MFLEVLESLYTYLQLRLQLNFSAVTQTTVSPDVQLCYSKYTNNAMLKYPS